MFYRKVSWYPIWSAIYRPSLASKYSRESINVVWLCVVAVLVLQVASGMILVMAFFLITYTFHSTWVTSEAYSSPSIVLSARGGDGSRIIFDDFREAYYWLRHNTPEVSGAPRNRLTEKLINEKPPRVWSFERGGHGSLPAGFYFRIPMQLRKEFRLIWHFHEVFTSSLYRPRAQKWLHFIHLFSLFSIPVDTELFPDGNTFGISRSQTTEKVVPSLYSFICKRFYLGKFIFKKKKATKLYIIVGL